MATADEGPLRLLSLDGGGVRGLSSLIILKHLMQTVDADSPPKPCDYFDLIGGTSTGGLIAIMLGRLKMDIDTCIDKYLRLSGEVFQPKRRRLDLFGRGGDALKLRGRFSSKKLEEKIQEIVKEQEEDADALLKVEKSPKCKVFVCATRADTGIHTVLLRSYASRQVAEVDCTIWEAARATSAASGFFDPIKIGKFGEQFLDGATGANNPIEKVLEEARAIWPDLTERLQCIVSIGTGQPSLLPFGSNLKQVATTLINIATETENTAKNFQINHVPSLGSPSHKKYFRFNVAKGLEEVGLEEHERKAQIAATTKVYLETPETGTDIQTCAALLKGGTPDRIPESHRLPKPRMSTLIARLRAASTRSLTRWCSDVADPEEGTFEWILKRPAFLTLLQPDSSGILHILGKPGCGKTVLAKHIYYKFDAFTGPATKYPVGKTLLFACDAAVDGSRAAINILTSLMTQMLEFQEESKEPLEPPLSSLALEETWSFHQLAEAFSGLITGLWPHILGTRKYAIVIDGLDECDSGSERDALLELFSKVAGASQGGTTPVAIVATSRPYAEISFSGGYTNILDLNTEKAMDQDLATYIRHGVANLVSKRPKLAAYQQVIVDKLENRADKMYLLIRLLLEVLLHMIDSSPYSIDSILVSLPETLSDIYDQIWSRVASAEEGRARMIFSWLLCAIRPFTLIELGIAIATYDYNKWHQQHEGTKFRLNIAGHETTRHIQDKNGLLTKIPPFHRARFEGYIPFMPLDLEGDLNRLFGPLVKISRSHKLSREGSEHEDSTTEESRNTEEGHTNVTHVNLVHSPTVDRMPWFRAKQNGDSTAAWPSSPEGWYEIDERKALDVIRRTERLLGPYSTSKGRDYSTKDLEPKVTLCHQTVQEHFSSKPGFLDEPGTHLQLAELCARTRDGTVTGDSDTESIDTLDEATATQPDDSRDYSEYWRDHRLMAVMLDPWLNGKVRLRRRRTAPSKLVIRQRESDYNF